MPIGGSHPAPAALGLVLLLGASLLGCPAAAPEGEPELETTDIDGGPTTTLTPAGDEVEARRQITLAGVLPGDLPEDLPIYLPASVLDYGDLEGGRRFVSLSTVASSAQVERELRRSLDSSGWQASAANPLRRRRGDSEVVYQLSPGQGIGTVIRIEYTPRG